MNTSSYKRGSSSPSTKRVIYICNVHSKIHEDNTSSAAKRLNFKRCMCMIQFLYSILILELTILFLDDVELNSRRVLGHGYLFHVPCKRKEVTCSTHPVNENLNTQRY